MSKPIVYRPNLKGKADPAVVRVIENILHVLHGPQGVVPSVQNLKQAGFITSDEAEAKYGPHATRKALSIGGSHPHIVQGLIGRLAQGQQTYVPAVANDPGPNDPLSQEGTLIVSNGVKKVYRVGPPPGWVAF